MKINKSFFSKLNTFKNIILKNIIIPKTNRISLLEFFNFYNVKIKRIGLSNRASAISFNLIMAMPAFLLLSISFLDFIPFSINLKNQLLLITKDLVPNSYSNKFANDLIATLLNKKITLFSFIFPIILFYSSNAMLGIIKCFNFSIKENRGNFLYHRLKAIILTFFLVLLFIIAQSCISGINNFLNFVFSHLKFQKSTQNHIFNFFYWICMLLFLFYSISFIYRFAPNIREKWNMISYGSIIATSGILLSILIFSFWVKNYAQYDKVYGSIGGLMILFFLIYLNSYFLLIGFEINVSIYSLKQSHKVTNG